HPLEVDRGLPSNLGRSRSGLQGNGGHGLLLGTRSRESRKGVFKDNATRAMDRDQRPARGAGYWARRGNDDYEFGLSFGSLMARLRASDIGNWMLMARGGIGRSNHWLYSFSNSPERISPASVSSTSVLNC